MVKEIHELVAPYFCHINLTSRCNLRCVHCLGDYGEERRQELILEDWKRVIDNLSSLKVFYLNISGGEPTVHPDFEEIIAYISKKGIHFILTTNGIMSDKKRNAIIKNTEFMIGIKISLDGYDEKSHGYIRRGIDGRYNPRFFKKTMDIITYFKKTKMPMTIASVIHSRNIDGFDKFVKLIKQINPTSWYISPIIPSGRGNFHDEIKKSYNYYDSSFWKNLVDECNKESINVNLIDLPFDITGSKTVDYYECGASLTFCEIHADGTVAPCTLCRTCIPDKFMKFDNIKNKSLEEIWHGKIFNEFRNYMTSGCEGCNAFSKCNKCIAQSFRYFESGDMPTPYCVRNGRKLGLKELGEMKKHLREEHGVIV